MKRSRLCSTLVLGAILASPVQSGEGSYRFHHENVLGTTCEIRVASESAVVAEQAESAVLDRIDRLEATLSEYDADSDFSRWMRAEATSGDLSVELTSVLRACDDWRISTEGAFEPRAAELQQLWETSLAAGVEPSAVEIAAVKSQWQEGPWQWDGAVRPIAVPSSTALTISGLAKGYIIDRACDAAMAVPGVRGVAVNIGGDFRAAGELPIYAGVANPFRDGELTLPIARFPVVDGAVATSGDYQRFTFVGGKRYSHIMNPHSGRPASGVASVTVFAPQATDADALATALHVMPAEAGLALVERTPDASCLMVASDGSVTASRRWPGPHPERIAREPAATRMALAANEPWGAGYDFSLEFDVANPDTDGRYRRPYVGIWVTDHEGFPVRTLVLWLQKDGRRWLPSLREWYRDDQIRGFVDARDLVELTSRATRPPGHYTARWDGTDDHGDALPPGEYTLFIEASREHGTHQVMKTTLHLGDQPFEKTLEGNVEISQATIRYERRTETD